MALTWMIVNGSQEKKIIFEKIIDELWTVRYSGNTAEVAIHLSKHRDYNSGRRNDGRAQ